MLSPRLKRSGVAPLSIYELNDFIHTRRNSAFGIEILVVLTKNLKYSFIGFTLFVFSRLVCRSLKNFINGLLNYALECDSRFQCHNWLKKF